MFFSAGKQNLDNERKKVFFSYITLIVKMRYARANVFKHYFFNRVVGTWNSLPLSIREATSVNIFKVLVRKFFMD